MTESPSLKIEPSKVELSCANDPFDEALVQTALRNGFMIQEQIEECVREKELLETLGARQTIGQICVRRGYLSEKQVQTILRAHHYRKIRSEDMEIGRVAVKKDYATSEQVLTGLKIQEQAYKKGCADIPRLVHILGDQGLLSGQKAVNLLEAVHEVDNRGRSAPATTMEEWAIDQKRKNRHGKRVVVRESERFVVPDAYLKYHTGLLDSLMDPDDEQSPLIDLSQHGMQFLSRKKLSIGQKVRLELMVPAFPEKLTMKAEVRWVGRAGLTKLYRIGVRFIDMDKEIASYLRKISDDPFLRSVGRSPYRVYR